MASELEIKEDSASGEVALYFSGELDLECVSDLWRKSLRATTGKHIQKILVDVQKTTRCDSAAIGLLTEIKRRALLKEKTIEFEGLTDHLKVALQYVGQTDPEVAREEKEAQHNIAEEVGMYAVGFYHKFRAVLVFTGELLASLAGVLVKPKKNIRWRDVWKIMETSGPNALPLVCMLGLLIGLTLSFQAVVQLQKFGIQIFVVNIVGVGLTREMAPLFTAILLAGRTASAFAAEIGTMKVNQELDALSVLGIPPIIFLAIPRVIAVTLMLPILSLFMAFFGLLGCALFLKADGYAFNIFFNQLHTAVSVADFWGGFFKAFLFGFIIAAIGCWNGLQTKFGASSVGASTTRSVVHCIVMLVIVDTIFVYIFYVLGI